MEVPHRASAGSHVPGDPPLRSSRVLAREAGYDLHSRSRGKLAKVTLEIVAWRKAADVETDDPT